MGFGQPHCSILGSPHPNTRYERICACYMSRGRDLQVGHLPYGCVTLGTFGGRHSG